MKAFFRNGLLTVLSVVLMFCVVCFATAEETLTIPADFLPGDVDYNGSVESSDARLALRASVKLEHFAKNSPMFLAADVDQDERITSSDARTILRVSVKLETLSVPHTIHTWDNGTVTKPATCAQPGVITYTCTVCGETETGELPATGLHQWEPDSVIKAASCTEPGEKTLFCPVCGAVKTEIIPAMGHEAVTDTAIIVSCTRVEKTESSHCARCGQILQPPTPTNAPGPAWQGGGSGERVVCDDLLPAELQAEADAYTEQIVVHFVDEPETPPAEEQEQQPGGDNAPKTFLERFHATLAAILALFKKIIKLFIKQ